MPWSSVSKLSQKPKVVLKFEWEHYFKLIFVRRKLCICGFAEVLSTQKIVGSAKNSWVRKSLKIDGPQIRKLSHLRKFRKSNKITSANLRICDLQNLIADGPPLVLSALFHSISLLVFLDFFGNKIMTSFILASAANPGCLSWILISVYPGSQISDPGSKNRNKKRRM